MIGKKSTDEKNSLNTTSLFPNQLANATYNPYEIGCLYKFSNLFKEEHMIHCQFSNIPRLIYFSSFSFLSHSKIFITKMSHHVQIVSVGTEVTLYYALP